MSLKKVRVKYNSWLVPPGFAAWVIYPYMFFRPARKEISDRLFRHELQHVYQVQKNGWLKFYLKYLLYSLRYGYKKNPYEVEARQMQDRQLSPEERSLKDKS